MGIRVEHSGSAAAIGNAAYMTGLGRASERKNKYLMDMWQRERMMQGRRSPYRQTMQQGGMWENPLANAEGADAVQIRAAQKANARRFRLGKEPLDASAQPKYISPDMLKRRQELADEQSDRDFEMKKMGITREHKLADVQAGRDYTAQQQAQQGTLDLLKSDYEDFDARLDELRKVPADAWQDRTEFDKLTRGLDVTRKAMQQDSDNRDRLQEYYTAANKAMGEFFAGFNQDQSIIPPEGREGYESINDKTLQIERRGKGGVLEPIGPAPWGQLTPEQQERAGATVVRGGREGQMIHDGQGNYRFTPYEAPTSQGEQAQDLAENRSKLFKNLLPIVAAELGGEVNDSNVIKETRKRTLETFPDAKPGGGDTPGAAGPNVIKFDTATAQPVAAQAAVPKPPPQPATSQHPAAPVVRPVQPRQAPSPTTPPLPDETDTAYTQRMQQQQPAQPPQAPPAQQPQTPPVPKNMRADYKLFQESKITAEQFERRRKRKMTKALKSVVRPTDGQPVYAKTAKGAKRGLNRTEVAALEPGTVFLGPDGKPWRAT